MFSEDLVKKLKTLPRGTEILVYFGQFGYIKYKKKINRFTGEFVPISLR